MLLLLETNNILRSIQQFMSGQEFRKLSISLEENNELKQESLFYNGIHNLIEGRR